MQRINRVLFKFPSKTVNIFCLLLVFSFVNIALSQGAEETPENTADTKIIREKIEQFLSLDSSSPAASNSHIYLNIYSEIINNEALLDLAEQVIKKGINVNTIDNLRKSYPDMSRSGIEDQQKLEYGRLYSRYAWIHLQKGRLDNAHDAIKKAMSYFSLVTPEDYLILGVIEYENGEKQQGWTHIIEALVSDTIIEQQNPGYLKAISKIIKDKFGTDKEPDTIIDDIRKQNAETIPDFTLITLDNEKVTKDQYKGKVTFIIFFSPGCTSCRQEIPSFKNLFGELSQDKNLAFIFILNRPELKREAIDLFGKSGIDKPTIAILEEDSVWDYISAEPSNWIADKDGKIIMKHSGYKQGDELIYQRELSKLIQD
jgi:thiol-disulfide isomerase/thioredoxin